MPKEKTLYELGKEYEKAAECVKSRIAQKRMRLRSLKNSVCSNEAYILKSELSTLYREYREAKETAEYLKSYYNGGGKNDWGGIAA